MRMAEQNSEAGLAQRKSIHEKSAEAIGRAECSKSSCGIQVERFQVRPHDFRHNRKLLELINHRMMNNLSFTASENRRRQSL